MTEGAVDDQRVLVETDGYIATITIAHPPVNALSIPLLGDLQAAAERVGTARGCRAVIVRSGVPGVFVGGADLKERERGNNPSRPFIAALHAAFGALERIAAPTIALIEGHALGGGCELALACDFRLMTAGRARIGLPEVKLGLLAAGGGTQRLTRLLGRGAATDIILRGRVLDASAAERAGLIHWAIAEDRSEGASRALADELAALPPLAVAAAKRVIRDGAELPLADALALEARAMLDLEHTADAAEGVRAFVEKRPPRFTGR